MKNVFKIINGDSYEELKKFPDNYFDSVITDPPYGLGKEPNAEEVLKAWTSVGYLEVKGSGFMGKEWDAFVPQPLFWKEVFRVLKHGGHVVAFFGTRTYDWGVMAMRLGGFEIRDCIQWLYGSGFPKSHNISKAIDKMYGAEREVVGEIKRGDVEKAKLNGSGYLSDPANRNNEKQFGYGVEQITLSATEQAKQWDGWGSALKPANEPIVLARKPLEKGLSIAENVLKWGTGAINIDGCRVKGSEPTSFLDKGREPNGNSYQWSKTERKETFYDGSQGRFPANLILTHHPECECVGTKKVKSNGNFPSQQNTSSMMMNSKGKSLNPENDYSDENGQETIEDWTCHEDCPIKIMDEQSGDRKGWASQNHNSFNPYGGNSFNKSETDRNGFHQGYNDTGGASRFFYVAKASKSERNFGLEEFEEKQTIGGGGTYNEEAGAKYGSIKAVAKNFHPTVKPVKLMQYLVRLITPPNGKVLDPFNGSGTTGIACTLENLEYTGIELDADYCKISEARITNWSEIDEYEQYKIINQEDELPTNNAIQTKLFE
jgi:DNA modification methylase